MTSKSIIFIIAVFVLSSCGAQPHNKTKTANSYTIAFYNVENLFDTIDNPDTYDEDFTPKGAYRYTEKVYQQKLNNIATVISKLEKEAPVIVGMAEIENNNVLHDLTNTTILKKYNYNYISYNSPDSRGIDNALIYRSDFFKVLNSRPVRIANTKMRTRDILYVCGILDNDTLHLLVNHFPSRREGVSQSDPKRAVVARVNKSIADSLLDLDPDANIIIMGDMNDNPDDASITEVLYANDNRQNYLYNPWLDIYRSGKGTSVYHRKWDLFDQMIISKGMLDDEGLKYDKAEIFDADFIRNDYHGDDAYPKRSFKGRQWNNGYSDHLPVMLHFN